MNISLALPNWLVLALAILVAVLGVGRASRILTYDDFPPAMWLRMKWDWITRDGSWGKLLRCQWCATPYIMAVCVAWFFLGQTILWVAGAWWFFWGILALAYVASMVIVRDEE
jgi:hypothetical protein